MLPTQLETVLKRLAHFEPQKILFCKSFAQVVKNNNPARLEAFLLLILLLTWQSFYDLGQAEYQVVEYFAGCARISRMAAGLGYKSVAMDLVYDTPNYFEGTPTAPGCKPV